MLCLVLITAAVSTVSLIPSQSNDISSAEGVDKYVLTDGDKIILESSDELEEIIKFINDTEEFSVFTITVNGDDTISNGFTLKEGIEVTLTSSSSSSSKGPFTLTIDTLNERHFVVKGALTLKNIILDGGNEDNIGGGIKVETTGTLFMEKGAVIQNCSATVEIIMDYIEVCFGGGVYNDGMFTMNGGKIIGNTATNFGGGVYNKGKFIMNGGKISDNTAAYGGGVYNEENGIFTMNGGEISGNTASTQGGGVYNNWDGIFTMNGGEISGNMTTFFGGGIRNAGEFTMSGGKISGNTTNGGGGGIQTAGEFTMSGGKISGNTAYEGGGVHNAGEFTMSGGKISGNTANKGGGVYNMRMFTMEGGAISGNTAESVGYYLSYGGGVFNAGTLTIKDGVISGNTAVFAGGVHNYNPEDYENNAKFIMEGGIICGNTAEYVAGGVYNAQFSTFDMTNGVIKSNKVTGDEENPDAIGGGVVNVSMFTMSGGEISGNTSVYNGGGVYNMYMFTMEKGKISDNTAEKFGGGVYNEGDFTLKGGEISDNKANEGGGVYIHSVFDWGSGELIAGSSVFTMENGNISDNIAEKFGGGVYNEDTFVMNNGEISRNGAENGGGVYNNATLTITGGSIIGNTANGPDTSMGSGGGIFTTNFSKLTVEDGVVFSDNKAPTLRTNNITDESIYSNIGAVVLSVIVKPGLNAPAFNNYDINYSGDVYVVAINIIPSGGGTVTVTYENGDTVYADRYAYVPLPGGNITLSATPEKGYEFVLFLIGEKESFDKSITFKVSGDMEVTAEFLPVSTEPEQPEQPEQKDYFITASAGDGSTISPSGTVTVPYGENKTFLFSAKPGYQIKAVYVNGVEISSAELASGAYTFSNVMSNHTISVVSEIEAGSGGDLGGDGSDGTGSGPDVSGSDNLYIYGIICAMLAVIAGAVVFVWRKGYFGSNNE